MWTSMVIAVSGAALGLVLALLARGQLGWRGGAVRLAAMGVALVAQGIALWLAGPAAGPILVVVALSLGYSWYLNEIAHEDCSQPARHT